MASMCQKKETLPALAQETSTISATSPSSPHQEYGVCCSEPLRLLEGEAADKSKFRTKMGVLADLPPSLRPQIEHEKWALVFYLCRALCCFLECRGQRRTALYRPVYSDPRVSSPDSSPRPARQPKDALGPSRGGSLQAIISQCHVPAYLHNAPSVP